MANEQNLHKFQSVNEAREKGRKGGIASGKSRNRRRAFCKLLQEIGDLPAQNAAVLTEEFPGLTLGEINNLMSLALALYKKAQTGDIKAIQAILYYISQTRTVNDMDLFQGTLNPFNPLD